MARYSDIRRGGQLNAELTRYISYLTTPRERKVGQGKAREARVAVWVNPFGRDLATDTLALTYTTQADITALAGRVNTSGTGAELVTTLGSKGQISINGFSPARLIYFSNATKTKSVVTSGVTGRKYLKYTGARQSVPFGRKLATDDQQDAFEGIKAAIIAADSGKAVKRFSLSLERFKQG